MPSPRNALLFTSSIGLAVALAPLSHSSMQLRLRQANHASERQRNSRTTVAFKDDYNYIDDTLLDSDSIHQNNSQSTSTDKANSPIQDSILGIVTTATFDTLENCAQAVKHVESKSRPKKKPVSKHSTLSTVAAGSYLTSYLPFLHPGLDRDGYLQFFDFYRELSVDTCHQIQFGVAMMALSGILGYFRIPPRSPASRRIPFTLAALSNIFFALVTSSTLSALPEEYCLFDAFSVPGTVAIGLTFFAEAFCMVSALDNAICGSKAGLDATPGALGRGLNVFFASFIYFFVFGAQIPLVAPIFFSDLPSYQESMSVAFEAVGMSALNFHSFATAVGFVSFLQLVATFQFEKKISQMQGLISFVLLFVGFNCDAVATTYKTVCRPDVLPIIEKSHNYLPDLLEQHHLVVITVVMTCFVVLNGVRKALVAESDSR